MRVPWPKQNDAILWDSANMKADIELKLIQQLQRNCNFFVSGMTQVRNHWT